MSEKQPVHKFGPKDKALNVMRLSLTYDKAIIKSMARSVKLSDADVAELAELTSQNLALSHFTVQGIRDFFPLRE